MLQDSLGAHKGLLKLHLNKGIERDDNLVSRAESLASEYPRQEMGG